MVLKLSEEVQCQDFETFGYFQNYFYWVLGGFFFIFLFWMGHKFYDEGKSFKSE